MEWVRDREPEMEGLDGVGDRNGRMGMMRKEEVLELKTLSG